MATLDAGSAAVADPSDQSPEAPAPALVEVVELAPPEAQLTARRRAHLVWAAATTFVLLFALVLLKSLPTVGWPVVLAFIGAYLLDPVVAWMARRNVSRTATAAALIVLGGVVMLGLVVQGIPKLLSQASHLPHFITSAIDLALSRLALFGDATIPADFEALLRLARAHVPEILTEVLPGAGSVVTTVLGGSLSALSWVLSAIVVPVVGFYLLKGWPNVISNVDSLVPPRQKPFFRERMKEVDTVLNGFIRGQLTMAAVLATLYGTALTAVGLKMAFIIGLVTGFGNIVPYVGTACGISLMVVSCLVDFGVDYHLPVALLVFGTILVLDSVFITPKIVGNRVGLSPAAVIVSVLACGSIFGFAGVLLAVPTVATMKIVLRVLVGAYRESKLYTDG